MGRAIYFYPHTYLRDQQLDTIRNWPAHEVVNPQMYAKRVGAQVQREKSLARKQRRSWKQSLPLINLKRRPHGLPKDTIVYVWGGIIASGPFIVDLESPYALTGYNLRAMQLYRGILGCLLNTPRCLEIRCWSEACRETLKYLFGKQVCKKATVHYPHCLQMLPVITEKVSKECHFLFISTQFDIKGGAALLRAFQRAYRLEPKICLDLVTHLPPEYSQFIDQCSGITVHEARFSRTEVYERFMRCADVLVHPTYMDSFGWVVLEALAHGLAVIATDVYALREMVIDGMNGALLKPPISIWDGYLPSKYYHDWPKFKEHVRRVDTTLFEDQLAEAMLQLAQNPEYMLNARRASLRLFEQRFAKVPTRLA